MAEQKIDEAEAKRRRENYEKFTMRVSELYAALGELIKKGDGDAMIDVDDNCGGSYPMAKFGIPNGTAKLEATNGPFGKWVFFGP